MLGKAPSGFSDKRRKKDRQFKGAADAPRLQGHAKGLYNAKAQKKRLAEQGAF
jgi:hypothetical protein